jgi:regulator of cell morphogenesis and NO signaling
MGSQRLSPRKRAGQLFCTIARIYQVTEVTICTQPDKNHIHCSYFFSPLAIHFHFSMSTLPHSLSNHEEAKQILQRYDVTKAHNIVYTHDELKDLGIPPEFLLALLEIFEDQAVFKPSNFDRFSLQVIIDYLRKTHSYYLDKKLLEIEQSIHLLVNAYPSAHPLLVLLHNFYSDYKNHLVRHIQMEEGKLLPYIIELEQADELKRKLGTAPSMTVKEFISQHHDTEKDLEEVRKTILSYSPPEGNQTLYRILLSQLQVFEKDMAVHAQIEDDVLLPRALELENKLLTPHS